MPVEDEVVSGWYFVCYILAWCMACLSSMIVAVIVLRGGTAMRHDTVSSFISGHSDGSRMLVVCLTMTTWAVLTVHLMEYEIRRLCGSNTGWASVMTIIAHLGFTLTFCIPGGKYYVTAVRANNDIRHMQMTITIAPTQPLTQVHTTPNQLSAVMGVASGSIGLQDVSRGAEQSEEAIARRSTVLLAPTTPRGHDLSRTELASASAFDGAPASAMATSGAMSPRQWKSKAAAELDNITPMTLEEEVPQGLSRADRTQSEVFAEAAQATLSDEESFKLTRQIQLLLPADDAFFADGHLLQEGGFASQTLITCVNLSHGIGMVAWLLLMTPVEIHSISQAIDDDRGEYGVVGALLLGGGWLFFFIFQYISCYKVNTRVRNYDAPNDWQVRTV